MKFAGVTPHHCFIAAIGISFVSRVAMGLEGLVAAACGFTAPRIQVDRARDCTQAVCYALTLRNWILMHPTNLAVFRIVSI